MSPVHKLTAMGSLSTNKVDYPSMLAGYGDFGALQRIASFVGSNSTNGEVISVSNIPQTFQDLLIVCSVLPSSSTGSNTFTFGFNNSGNFQSGTLLKGNGSAATSTRDAATTTFYPIGVTTPMSATNPASIVIHILNYANTTTFKTVLVRSAADNNGSGHVNLYAGTYLQTNAITGMAFSTNMVGNFWSSNSRFALYGVRASAA